MEKTRKQMLQISPFPVFSYVFTNHTRCVCTILKNLKTDGLDKIVEFCSEGILIKFHIIKVMSNVQYLFIFTVILTILFSCNY